MMRAAQYRRWRSCVLATYAAVALNCGLRLAAEDSTQTSRQMTPAEVAQNYVEAGESEQALRYLINPSLPGHQAVDALAARLEVARMEHLLRKDAAALARCRELLALEPLPEVKLATRLLLADLYIAVDLPDRAEPLLAELRDEVPFDQQMAALAWRWSVDSLLHNRGEVAEPWLHWLAALPADSPKEKAKDLIRRISEEKAATAPYWSADFLLDLGALLEAEQEPVLADRTYVAILEHWPRWKPDHVLAKQAWNLLNFHNDEAIARAVKLFSRLVSEYPKSEQVPPALFRLHFLYWNGERDFERAKTCLRRIIDDYPESKETREALFQLASVEMSDHPETAIALFKRIIQDYPEDAGPAQVNIDRLQGKRRD